MKHRPAIPQDLKRKILVEAGHRCAIPTCPNTEVEIAHIIPWAKVREHTYDNLIALCPLCHKRADDGKIDRKSLYLYKSNLKNLTDRHELSELTHNVSASENIHKFLKECLTNTLTRPAADGSTDEAITALSEKILGETSDFTVVDFGCGMGRLVCGLNGIDPKTLSLMTYIGVDHEKSNLQRTKRIIKESGFCSKIKSYKLMCNADFFSTTILKVDFIFIVNVLHGIHLADVPLILQGLDERLKKGGEMFIHEISELKEGEYGFVTWEQKDFEEVFDVRNTNFKSRFHPYLTRTGMPLINVLLVKEQEEKADLFTYIQNVQFAYYQKLKRIEQALSIIKSVEKDPKKYAYLLVLEDNIQLQQKDCGYQRDWALIENYEPAYDNRGFNSLLFRSDGKFFKYVTTWVSRNGFQLSYSL